MPETLPRAVELIRVSTTGQAERDTPELQRRALDRLRVSRPSLLVERVEALGVSGALGAGERDDLQRLAALAEARAFDELRVWSLDRLTRADDPRERMAIFGMALDAGAVIVDATGKVIDPADESGIGELDWYLQTFFASRERRKIVERTRAGRRRAAEDGLLSQGSPPYGRRFDHETHSWVLVPEQAEVYRRIVGEILAGRSTRQIVAALNRDRVPAARSDRWWESSVKRLLHTEAIVGRYKTCGCTTQIPPIVDEVTWARARAALEGARASHGPTASRPALLRGRLVCGACGQRARVITYDAASPSRYGCPAKNQRSAGSPECSDRRTIPVAAADESVREALVDVLSAPNVLRAAVKAGRDETPEAPSLESVEEQQRQLERQEGRVLRLLDDGLLSEAVARERLADVKASRAELARKRMEALARGAEVAEDGDVERAVSLLAPAVRRASAEQVGQLVELLFPRRQPYGMRLTAEGIECHGWLELNAAAIAGRMATSSARSAHSAGSGVPLRFLARVQAGRGGR